MNIPFYGSIVAFLSFWWTSRRKNWCRSFYSEDVKVRMKGVILHKSEHFWAFSAIKCLRTQKLTKASSTMWKSASIPWIKNILKV